MTACRTLTSAEQSDLTKEEGDKLQADLRKESKLEDRVVWRPSELTPICPACGSGPPV